MALYTTTLYESNGGLQYSIRLLAARAAEAGTPPAAGVRARGSVRVGKTNREFGIRPRGVLMSRIVGTGNDASKKYSFLPVLTQADWEDADFQPGIDKTIGAVTWTIVKSLEEDAD